MPGIKIPEGASYKVGTQPIGTGASWFHPAENPVTLANGEEVTVTHAAVNDSALVISVFTEVPPPVGDDGYAIPEIPTILGSGEYGPWVDGNSGTYRGQNAFDGTTLTWLGARSSAPQWIAVDLGEARTIVEAGIRKTNQNDNYNPKFFKIEYNNAGLDQAWSVALDRSATPITYDVDNWWHDTFTGVSARYWRLYIIEGLNGSHADGYGCGEFALYTEPNTIPTIEPATLGEYDSLAPFGCRRLSQTQTKIRNQSGSEKTIYVGISI